MVQSRKKIVVGLCRILTWTVSLAAAVLFVAVSAVLWATKVGFSNIPLPLDQVQVIAVSNPGEMKPVRLEDLDKVRHVSQVMQALRNRRWVARSLTADVIEGPYLCLRADGEPLFYMWYKPTKDFLYFGHLLRTDRGYELGAQAGQWWGGLFQWGIYCPEFIPLVSR